MAIQHIDEGGGQLVQRGASSLDLEGLLRAAVENQAAVETMERLLAMRDRVQAQEARSAYFEALSAFQATCPVIKKTKSAGSGTYQYKYAPLEAIVQQVSANLHEHGLSYRFDTRFESDPPAQVVVCTVYHTSGHSESSEFRTPVDAGARMNDMQKSASAQTYAKRYAFCNSLGILTGDDDDDGHSGGGNARQQVASPPYQPPSQRQQPKPPVQPMAEGADVAEQAHAPSGPSPAPDQDVDPNDMRILIQRAASIPGNSRTEEQVRQLVTKHGFQGIADRVLSEHERACGPDCAHITGEIAQESAAGGEAETDARHTSRCEHGVSLAVECKQCKAEKDQPATPVVDADEAARVLEAEEKSELESLFNEEGK